MRPRRGRPALALLLALAAVALIGCSGSGDGSAGSALAERWLRVGEDYQTNVLVYDNELPPSLSDLLNPGAAEDAAEEELVSLPVHPDGELLGSYLLRRADGSTLVWLFFDVMDATLGDVSAAVGAQMDESPWQVIGQQANRSFSIITFQSTRSDDIEGSVIVEPTPPGGTFDVVVSRDGSDRTIAVRRGALSPLLEVELSDDLTVSALDAGLARDAGLQEGDRIIRVGGTDVASPDDLAQALHDMAGTPNDISVVYVLQIAPTITVAPTFVEAGGISLPEGFPLRDALAGLTVNEFQSFQDPSGDSYFATLVSRDSTAAVADAVRDALGNAGGWEITSDEPVGFATELSFQNADEELQGIAQIDTFAQDEGFTQVLIQIQTGLPTGG